LAFSQEAVAPEAVTILDTPLVLKYHQTKNGQTIFEYTQDNETLEQWSLMFAVRVLPGKNLSPYASVQATAQKIAARKKQGDPVANSLVMKSDDGDSYAIDFLISEGTLIEHNVFRYLKTEGGMMSYQIARRVDISRDGSETVQQFIKAIPNERGRILRELLRKDLPVPGRVI